MEAHNFFLKREFLMEFLQKNGRIKWVFLHLSGNQAPKAASIFPLSFWRKQYSVKAAEWAQARLKRGDWIKSGTRQTKKTKGIWYLQREIAWLLNFNWFLKSIKSKTWETSKKEKLEKKKPIWKHCFFVFEWQCESPLLFSRRFGSTHWESPSKSQMVLKKAWVTSKSLETKRNT